MQIANICCAMTLSHKLLYKYVRVFTHFIFATTM